MIKKNRSSTDRSTDFNDCRYRVANIERYRLGNRGKVKRQRKKHEARGTDTIERRKRHEEERGERFCLR